MDFGAFILGILFGWLVEWLYVTFFSGQGSNMGDCSAFERELKTRNEEIKSLKSQLGASESGASLLSKKMTTSTVSSKPKPAKLKSTSPTKKAVGQKTAKKPTIKNSTASVTKSKPASTNKIESAKTSASTKKSAALKKTTTTTKKAVTKQPKSASTTSSTKKTTKKAVSPKPISKAAKSAKQSTAKKKPATKKISLKKDIKLNNPTGDDLTKLSGIGPSMAATLAELGITSYKKLAAMDDDILRDMLEASGARLNNNKEAMDSWNEQATLADKGDFVGLKKLQDNLKS